MPESEGGSGFALLGATLRGITKDAQAASSAVGKLQAAVGIAEKAATAVEKASARIAAATGNTSSSGKTGAEKDPAAKTLEKVVSLLGASVR